MAIHIRFLSSASGLHRPRHRSLKHRDANPALATEPACRAFITPNVPLRSSA